MHSFPPHIHPRQALIKATFPTCLLQPSSLFAQVFAQLSSYRADIIPEEKGPASMLLVVDDQSDSLGGYGFVCFMQLTFTALCSMISLLQEVVEAMQQEQ